MTYHVIPLYFYVVGHANFQNCPVDKSRARHADWWVSTSDTAAYMGMKWDFVMQASSTRCHSTRVCHHVPAISRGSTAVSAKMVKEKRRRSDNVISYQVR